MKYFIGKEGSKLREVEEYAYSLFQEDKEETVGDPEYNPYCTECSSCGENGCCPYTACVFKAMDSNKGCFYPETYKREILIRDYFMEECFKNSSPVFDDFLERMYDVSFEKADEYIKSQAIN